MFAKVFKNCGNLALDLTANSGGHNNFIGVAQRFQPRRDIHAVAVDIVAIHDHIADDYPNARFNPMIQRNNLVAPGKCVLDFRAHSLASTALANSTSMPSPMVYTTRPL